VALAIDRVGVKGLKKPIRVRDRRQGESPAVAVIDLSVDLPARFKGTHMSRFVEALEEFTGALDHKSFRALLASLRDRLQAKRSHARLAFTYFMPETSPEAGAQSLAGYDCFLEGDLEGAPEGEKLTLTVGADVPVMTVCPCSLAICDGRGAHSQRAVVRIRAKAEGFVWIEELVAVAQAASSSPVYSLLKRADEKKVVETAFAKPAFVEDVVRAAARALLDHKLVNWFRVEVESLESIHPHNAFAVIERDKRAGG
jgi:GTP cyclohydrolase IB